MNSSSTSGITVPQDQIASIAGRLERLPYTQYQFVIFVIIATAWFFDAIDLGALTFLLGSIKSDMQLTTSQTGLLSSASFFGMFLGAGLAGIVADRFGRRTVFQISMVIWGLGSILCGLSPDAWSLGVARVVVGFGMGMEFPVAQALVAEMTPSSHRGRFIAILEGCWPIGFITAGLIALYLLPISGWRPVFFVEGIPAVFVFVVRWFVPESPRWLASRGRTQDAERVLIEIENKVKKHLGGTPLPAPVPISDAMAMPFRVAFGELWKGIYAKRTTMVWLLWFFALLGYYGLTTWLSAMLQQKGYPASKSVYYTVLISLAGIPGFITAAWLIEAVGRRYSISGLLIGSAIFAFLYGTAANQNLLITYGLGMQFCFFGMWSVLYAYTPELYPTHARATGAGCASSIGRLGGLLGPSIVGFILPIAGQTGVFMLGAMAFIAAAIVVITLGVETKGKVAEIISPV